MAPPHFSQISPLSSTSAAPLSSPAESMLEKNFSRSAVNTATSLNANLSYPDTETPLTVSQLSIYLKQYIEKGFSAVRLKGEISGCKKHTSGHTYFSLKDDQAVLDAICWRGTKLDVVLKDGDLIVCGGRITTYGGRSKYQLIIEWAQGVGQGTLLQQIETLKEKLRQEGLFAPERKKPLPLYPQCIGLITSPTGAVIQDMVHRFQHRLSARLLLYPVAVQGANSAKEVMGAIRYFHTQCSPRPDVLIVARGGGSIEDLWSFQDEALVRCVAASEIPIISAIGHETDTTLIDYAADFRAPTPTAAAERALPLVEELSQIITGYASGLKRLLNHQREMGQGLLSQLAHRLERCGDFPQRGLEKMDDYTEGLTAAITAMLRTNAQIFQTLCQRFYRALSEKWSVSAQNLTYLSQRLHQGAQHILQLHAQRMDNMTALLNTLSYERTLERGFTMTLLPSDASSGAISTAICSSAAMAAQADSLIVRFWDGDVTVRTEKA